jgi:hypothetical protein
MLADGRRPDALTGAKAMSDIVERLRGRLPYEEYSWDIAQEAAAEIERLRVALQTVRAENDRAKRQFTNVSNKILDDACRALEPKP